jgi:hypothetical protein
MVAEDDWRLSNASFLQGAAFRWKRWRQPSADWDHDHCVGCWAKFSLYEGDESLKEGYAITRETSTHGEDYYWICRSCFDDLKERLGWSEVSN